MNVLVCEQSTLELVRSWTRQSARETLLSALHTGREVLPVCICCVCNDAYV